MEIEKIILVTRLTRLEESIRRFNTKAQTKFYIESRGQSFDDYQLEYDNYHRAKDAVIRALPGDTRFQVLDRSFLPNYIFGSNDLVLTLGQDGLVVNAAKYLNGQPILAINPDPDRFDGVLLPFLPDDAASAIGRLEGDNLYTRQISMARVDLNDGQSMHAFNDFFIGASTHISARYTLSYREQRERHSSSGIIVSTPAGSTGWLSSLYNMAAGIQSFAGEDVDALGRTLTWEERRLVFMVREPFKSKWSGADLVAGEITANDQVMIESHMAEEGVIFSDGMHTDSLVFNSGATATIRLADKTTNLLVPELPVADQSEPTTEKVPVKPAKRPGRKAPAPKKDR